MIHDRKLARIKRKRSFEKRSDSKLFFNDYCNEMFERIDLIKNTFNDGLALGFRNIEFTKAKNINSLKNALANRKNRKKSKIPSKQEEQKDMALQRVKDRPYNPEDNFDTYKKRTQAMGGNVYTAAEMKSKGGRIGRKLGGGTDMGNTAVKKKHKGFSKLPETVQIKINKKLAKKV